MPYIVVFNKTLPAVSYANDMFVGLIPLELKDLSIIEEVMIAPSCHHAKCCILHLHESVDNKDNSNHNT